MTLLAASAWSWSPPLGRRAPRVASSSLRAIMMSAAAQGSKRAPLLPKSIDWTGTATQSMRSHSVLAAPPQLPASFTVLGIETSCDDTGVAVVRCDGTILGESIASQAELHEEWGGVMPGIARDAHAEALNRTIAEALDRAGLQSVADVDAVAVTVGPGLEICLRVGTEAAKALALEHEKPFVAVHHLEAHVLMARLACQPEPPPFPFLTLLVSGGHCQLLYSKGVGDHLVIGSTLDDALGEAYDKVARLLGLPIGGGGGPALEALAREGAPDAVPLPVPMQRKKSYDFSFAGLKTAVRLAVQRAPDEVRETRAFRAGVASSFQHAAISHLEQRIKYAMRLCAEEAAEAGDTPPSTLVVSGGVASNAELRRRLQLLCDATPAPAPGGTPWELLVPPPRLCTDNGVMVAWAACENLRLGTAHEAEGQMVRARWPLGPPATGARRAREADAAKRKGGELKRSQRATAKQQEREAQGSAEARESADSLAELKRRQRATAKQQERDAQERDAQGSADSLAVMAKVERKSLAPPTPL